MFYHFSERTIFLVKGTSGQDHILFMEQLLVALLVVAGQAMHERNAD